MNRIKELKINTSSNYTLVFTAFVIALLCFFFGERIQINDGLGMDGAKWYGEWAKDFYNQVVNIGLGSYLTGRILPSAIIHYSLRLLSIPLTNANIITAFSIYNLILITLIAYIWCLIADELKISTQGKWLGFTGLFLNYAVLKYTFYYPVVTDTFAYAIGTLMVFFFLKNRLVSLYLITVIGAFVWPTALYIGLLLLIFPKDAKDEVKFIPARFKLNIFFATVGVLIIFLSHYYLTFCYGSICLKKSNLVGIKNYFGLAISLLYLFFGISTILNNDKFFSLSYLFNNIKIKRLSVVLITFFSIKKIILLASKQPVELEVGLVFLRTIWRSISEPGIFYLAHIIYYGPILILVLFLWRKHICHLIQEHGIGLTLCTTIAIFLSLNSESRLFMHFYPFFIPFIVKAVDSLKWKKSYYWFFAIISILFSKVWLTINVGAWDIAKHTEFPAQYYFMNHGPWMSPEMYITQGVIVLLSMLLIYMVMFHRTKSTIK